MTSLVMTFGVGNIDTWINKAAEREAIFASLCSSYRIYVDSARGRVSIVAENVNSDKFPAAMATPEMAVTEPPDFYWETQLK